MKKNHIILAGFATTTIALLSQAALADQAYKCHIKFDSNQMIQPIKIKAYVMPRRDHVKIHWDSKQISFRNGESKDYRERFDKYKGKFRSDDGHVIGKETITSYDQFRRFDLRFVDRNLVTGKEFRGYGVCKLKD